MEWDGIEENIEKTKEIVELCHSKGVSVEAEVGSIGGEEDGVIGKGEVADPKECRSIADLGVDFFCFFDVFFDSIMRTIKHD